MMEILIKINLLTKDPGECGVCINALSGAAARTGKYHKNKKKMTSRNIKVGIEKQSNKL